TKINEGKISEEDEPVQAKTLAEKLSELKETAKSLTLTELSDETLEAFLNASPTQLAIAKDVIITSVRNVLNERITVGELRDAKQKAEEQIEQANLNASIRKPAVELARSVVVPNYFIDTEATKLKREKAKEAVQPVMIRQGQIIVQEGQVINKEIFEQLQVVGLLDDSFNVY